MPHKILLLTSYFLLLSLLPVSAKKRPAPQGQEAEQEKQIEMRDISPAYIYGVATPQADSTVIFTDVLILDPAQEERKTHFLEGRAVLATQLKKHLADAGVPGAVCSVTTSRNYKKLIRQYDKLQARYKKRHYVVKTIDQTTFRFTPIGE